MLRKGLFVAALALSSPAFAEWEFKVTVDPMSDAQRGIATLMGDQGLLVVKCDKNGPGELYLSVIAKKYLGGTSRDRRREMKFRYDGGAVQSIIASHDENVASIFDLKPKTAGGAFLAGLATSTKLVVQVTSFDYESHNIVFDTTGAKEAVEKAATTCQDTNWMTAPAAQE